MTRSPTEYVIAAILAVAALTISPIGIEFVTGRADLSFRVTAISVGFDIFLIAMLAAVLAQGLFRRLCFHAIAWTFPLAVLAALEGVALRVDLADKVAPLEDRSLLANKTPWPTYLLTKASYYTTAEGFVLYHPWQGDGITFNALGLRTAMPGPKAPGEWRIAITGGSAAWGWYVRDADTIAVRLQKILRDGGHPNVTVYNFGVGGSTLNRELALLKHFRDIYKIDQVVFFTGGNDVYFSYLSAASEPTAWIGAIGSFELVKTALRLAAMWNTPSAAALRHVDDYVLPSALKMNTLHKSIVAADEYCRTVNLRCDFVLQPYLSARKAHVGAEAAMERTLSRVYPRLDRLAARMYADALATGPAGHVFALTHIFDDDPRPLFLDFVHVNEEGYRIAAEQLVPIVSARLP